MLLTSWTICFITASPVLVKPEVWSASWRLKAIDAVQWNPKPTSRFEASLSINGTSRRGASAGSRDRLFVPALLKGTCSLHAACITKNRRRSRTNECQSEQIAGFDNGPCARNQGCGVSSLACEGEDDGEGSSSHPQRWRFELCFTSAVATWNSFAISIMANVLCPLQI